MLPRQHRLHLSADLRRVNRKGRRFVVSEAVFTVLQIPKLTRIGALRQAESETRLFVTKLLEKLEQQLQLLSKQIRLVSRLLCVHKLEPKRSRWLNGQNYLLKV